MKQKFFPLLLTIVFTTILIWSLFFRKYDFEIKQLYQNVNPLIGTDFHGHTFPGATMPFGMMQLSPGTRLDGWDGCSAFHYSDSIIYGFSHTHLSGTGCSDYGDILVMPLTNYQYDIKENRYTSKYRKENIRAHAGYYSVFLDDYQVLAELTSTLRTGFHRYSFPNKSQKYFCIDLEHRDEVIDARIKQINDTCFVGLRRSSAWAQDQILYFAIWFSEPVSVVDYDGEKSSDNSGIISGKKTKIVVKTFQDNDNPVVIKVALSATGEEGALKNLEAEAKSISFDKSKQNAENQWNKELSKILVEGENSEDITKFYTALYHCFIVPNIYSDVDGRFRALDLNVYENPGHDTYTVFSLWDTYRAIHPLFTIVQQKRTLDFIKTFLNHFKYGGSLPVWELSANETGCMIGYHSVPVIVDAYFKGINNFDTFLALKAMISAATKENLGKPEFEKYGFIPMEFEHESVSKTLEYAFDDWCIAKFAKALTKNDIFRRFIYRSQNYKNIFNPENGYMQPKFNSAFYNDFDPRQVNFNYTEANSWQYSFYVPHDILGLINLHGGKENFAKKLDQLFAENSEITGTNQVDITGMIGQYAHGNEPSHHVAYLYNYCGEPWKTQYLVRKIMRDQYSHKPDGLCGNEDCGQMSAWFVFSALGFYPVNPANGIYDLGSPLFNKAVIQLENGRKFTITAHNNNEKNVYVQQVRLNGKDYDKLYITHNDIMKGGHLEFFMGEAPNKNIGKNSVYQSKISGDLISPVPYFTYPYKTFKDTLIVELKTPAKQADIYYSIDDSEMSKPVEYSEKILLTNSHTIYAYSMVKGHVKSKIAVAEYKKIPNDRKIKILSKYSPQYSAGGDQALIDFVKSPPTFKSGMWQGYKGQNFEALIEFNDVKTLKNINVTFLQDTRSWIFFPTKVKLFYSTDGVNFKLLGEKVNEFPYKDETVKIQNFSFNTENVKAKYVKVFAESFGKLPEWHLSPGYDSWIFIDEIEVNLFSN
ncbi:MAG TPA: GH92 family glycosyl hydrolase [Bacteroidales bacterium]|nr:GH92 family glycosyl hydrolase [Bacteroidales bacterium]HOL97384.1 GH92 family glycosyl hydrolase [Bacteroidales bacterium]HOM36115.1 GH92 family glycosyl hydrolase [Bacteroidales bacterium]HRT79603.1 GH92 family glycosyl hydrolase [Bacteroidales bacterium]HUM31719.1 GH92 family glycosyl hydrolase [Bacteroidales bacterium]